MTTFDKLSDLIVEHLGVERELITLNASFKDDLGADSLDVVEFIMQLEDSFDIEIPDEEAEHLTTVGSIVTYLDEKL